MKKPILVIMAAGLGSRYGGLKQIAPVDDGGHILIDYSIYDALQAGFERVVCIIKRELEAEFREVISDRIKTHVEIEFAYQRLDCLPEGYEIPQGRTKPWGTAHAVLCAKDLIDAPLCVINADDFYGRSAFESCAQFLGKLDDPSKHAMVGYKVENTLTENGHVARGVCDTDESAMLRSIVERTHIEPREGGAAFTENGTDFTFVPSGTFVSMNLWGFHESIMGEIEARFAPWLDENLPVNPMKCEYFLPLIPNQLLQEKKATVQVLPTNEKWYGVTYADDMLKVRAALQRMRDDGIYPKELWG
ncbi:MAG: NTP transferase domain-containing protein [Clostridiales bacterium]|nr:NTP transferase domain-containing protein [Clostridiales bacterium]